MWPLTALAYLADVAILYGYFLMNKDPKRYFRKYNWVNIGTNLILVPYALFFHAYAEAVLGVAFLLIAIYGLVRNAQETSSQQMD